MVESVTNKSRYPNVKSLQAIIKATNSLVYVAVGPITTISITPRIPVRSPTNQTEVVF